MSAELCKSTLLQVKIRPHINEAKQACLHPILVFPDTGANICLVGPKQLHQLNIIPNQISSHSSNISVAGGTHIKASGLFKATIELEQRTTEQTVYFSKQPDRFFLGRQACIALGIVPSCFPQPLKDDGRNSQAVAALLSSSSNRSPPKKPSCIPFKPIEENIPKLKQFMIEQFSNSTFNKNPPFPKLSTPPAKIHLKPNYIIPKPAFWPATVADHWANEVQESINKDVASGVLIKVPFNEPTVWCARMVVVQKKDGRPRRTVDFQQLNSQCLREPNVGESPFHTARRVPQDKWKTTFDAVDGYHSVELDEESSKLTTFITPWGRYRYLRFPQGHCSAGDAFNGRVQHIMSGIPRLVRIVDDMCVYDDTIEDAFWHTWQVLSVCANNGIIINQSKFQFCCMNIEFAGLSITLRGIQPSTKMLSAIQNFPPPDSITKARAFFGLVAQVQWAYANGSDMAPFRQLVSPNSTFTWTPELELLFNQC